MKFRINGNSARIFLTLEFWAYLAVFISLVLVIAHLTGSA